MMWGVIGGLGIIVVVLLARGGNVSAPSSTNTPKPNGNTTAPITPAKPSGSTTQTPKKPNTPTAPKSVSGIAFTSPLGGTEWKIGELHTVSWSREGGLTGQLMLLDTKTKALIGVLNPSLGTRQTSYQWDTLGVAISRTNPSRKEITAGAYILKLAFDGPVGTVESAPFSLTHTSQSQTSAAIIAIEGAVFSPTTLRVKKGITVTFTNKDSVSYVFKINTFGQTIAPGASIPFETSAFFPGVYDLYSETTPSLKGSLIIE